MRGEHKLEDGTRRTRAGSSPHARGAHFQDDYAREAQGIIPACAGSTYFVAPQVEQ